MYIWSSSSWAAGSSLASIIVIIIDAMSALISLPEAQKYANAFLFFDQAHDAGGKVFLRAAARQEG